MRQTESFRATALDATFGATITGLEVADIDDERSRRCTAHGSDTGC
jgi:hypothetical protein